MIDYTGAKSEEDVETSCRADLVLPRKDVSFIESNILSLQNKFTIGSLATVICVSIASFMIYKLVKGHNELTKGQSELVENYSHKAACTKNLLASQSTTISALNTLMKLQNRESNVWMGEYQKEIRDNEFRDVKIDRLEKLVTDLENKYLNLSAKFEMLSLEKLNNSASRDIENMRRLVNLDALKRL